MERRSRKKPRSRRGITPCLLAAKGLLQLPLAPDETLVLKELRSCLDETLSKLPPRQAMIIRMRVLKECRLQDAAFEFGITVGHVSWLVRNGLKKLSHPRRAKNLKPFLR